MDFAMQNTGENPTRWRISILTRLGAVLAYTIPLVGGALSSLLLMRTYQAMQAAQTAGIVALMAGVKEAALPVTFSLYLAIFFGFIVIAALLVRAFVETKTASPPVWFFALCGLLCLIPAAIFWRAEWLTIEAVSPGSAVAAGGLGGVGAQVANLLIISVVSAPVIFLILMAAFAVPFKSRSKSNIGALAGSAAVELLLIAAAVAIPFLIGEPHRKQELVELPADSKTANKNSDTQKKGLVELPTGYKFADEDSDIQKDTSTVLLLTADDRINIERNPTEKDEKTAYSVTREELPGKIKQLMQDKSPDKRIVYLKADINTPFENVVQIFDVIRKNDIDKAGLVVYGETKADNPYQIYPKRFEVKLPELPSQSTAPKRPNPLTLIAFLRKEGNIALNIEDMGTISDPAKLTAMLTKIFKDRESNGVFREGTNEVEKTVFLKVSQSTKYGDFIKLVEAVRASGAEPVGVQIDDLPG